MTREFGVTRSDLEGAPRAEVILGELADFVRGCPVVVVEARHSGRHQRTQGPGHRQVPAVGRSARVEADFGPARIADHPRGDLAKHGASELGDRWIVGAGLERRTPRHICDLGTGARP